MPSAKSIKRATWFNQHKHTEHCPKCNDLALEFDAVRDETIDKLEGADIVLELLSIDASRLLTQVRILKEIANFLRKE